MDPELVLAVVGAVLFAAIVWGGALAQGLGNPVRDAEGRAWWALMRPLYAWGIVFAFLWGWSLQEPNPADERVGRHLELLAAIASVVALRALVRAVRAARARTPHSVPIATVGLHRPRIVVSQRFRDSASPEVVAAARAHEQAHVEHCDPLRIWLAQLAADLQWPMPGVSRRFAEWLLALEADRDSAALAKGADPEDLAEAIVTAARLQCGPTPVAAAAITGTGDGISWRVHRLLSPGAATPRRKPRPRLSRDAWIAALIGALCLGLVYGESVMHALFGVVR